MPSTISVSTVLTKGILEGFLSMHQRYKQLITKNFEDYAIRTYTKRVLFRDRTPEEAIAYARNVEYYELSFNPTYSSFAHEVQDFLKVIDNFPSQVVNLDVEFAAKIIKVTECMQKQLSLNEPSIEFH